MKRCRALKALLSGTAFVCLLGGQAAARGERVAIAAGSLQSALDAYIRQTGAQLIYNADDVRGLSSPGAHDVSGGRALNALLAGTGMRASRDGSGAIIISRTQRPEAPPAQILPPESVVVTGSRIRGNEERSTPVTSLPAEQLLAITPGGIPEALDKMPVFMSGATPNNATTGANGRGNNAPGYFLDMRSLGALRTLILEDGHRVPGTFYDTTVDIDMLPQMLVSRVEVVTGGASAVYGSDAVAGVVNFVLDRDFDGFKSVLMGGISGQGDTRSLRAGVAGGQDLGRGHLIWSAEYHNRAALPDAAARPLGDLGTSIVGAGTQASPYSLVRNIRQSNTAPGGLVVSGPGKGRQFLSDGTLAPFDPGQPTATANFAVGGDGGIEHNEYLLPAFTTGQVFARYGQPLGDAASAYVQARYALARSHEAGQIFTNINGSGISTNGASAQYPITIYSDNAFLTPQARAILFAAGGPGSFQMNRMDNDLMSRLALDQHTGALALSAGVEGQMGNGLHWDVHYTHGETRTELITRNNIDTARFYAALDAVRDPASGQIVCRADLVSPGVFPGCTPLNLFGQSATITNGSNASQAALDYVGAQTWWVAHNDMDDISANVTGSLLRLPAGEVRFAAGGEHRFARLSVATSTPDNKFNSQDLRLAPPGIFALTQASPDGSFPPANLAHFKEVQSGAQGSETISEVNLELDAPVLRDLPLAASVALDGAARYTEYHVGGADPAGHGFAKRTFTASTWKLGLDWRVNDSLRLRATRSRDIRAPTLWDLFQGPNTTTSGVSDTLTGISGSANTNAIGNPDLTPEVAHNTTAGFVYEPGWLTGARIKLNYFHIDIANQIAVVSGNSAIVQSLCLASPGGNSPYCGLIQRPVSYNSTSSLNFPSLFYSQPQNFQRQWTEGYDLEADYQAALPDWTGLNGVAGLSLLWTHTAFLKTRGLPGWLVTDLAGSANAPAQALPADKAVLMASYGGGGLRIDLMERYYGPLRPSINPVFVFDASVGNLPAWFQTDINLAWDLGTKDGPGQVFLNISNLFDAQPDIFQVPSYTGSPGMNYPVVPYEDIIGRYFTLGLRYRL